MSVVRKLIAGALGAGALALALALAAPAIADAHLENDGSTRYCGLTPSGAYQVRAGSTTSCPFARATATRFRQIQVARGGIPFGASLSMRVYSHVTHRDYRMRCSVSTPPVPRIACWSNGGANVWIGPR